MEISIFHKSVIVPCHCGLGVSVGFVGNSKLGSFGTDNVTFAR